MPQSPMPWLWNELTRRLGADDAAALRAEWERRDRRYQQQLRSTQAQRTLNGLYERRREVLATGRSSRRIDRQIARLERRQPDATQASLWNDEHEGES